ncbi:MAG: autotransporter outer membrane beta-barrel domain-containing protein, partial [Fusobacterium ulcerans]|uniref:autotransporter family protein n=1 Tax=Fusobacterium ulcerans TaxID=861 RepID=UPI003A8C3063
GEYTVINAKAEGTGNADITGTESLTFKEGTLSYKTSTNTTEEENIDSSKKYVLNGITDTLVVSTGDNKLSNSVINAYGTAVKFDTNGGKLTLVETIVNGGLDGSDVVVGSDKSDNLVLQGKSIINGNIVMGEGDDTLTIGSGAVINGTLNGGKASTSTPVDPITTFTSENNTLNFGTADSSSGEETRILHDISGFESININSKVTFYEKTVKADNKTAKDLEVTGVNNLTIGKGGVLTLRIDGANSNSHALSSGNTGTISSKEGGKLLLALNGVGNTATVSFGDLTLDDSLKTGHEAEYQRDVTLETTSVLHSVARTVGTNEIEITARVNLPNSPIPDNLRYEKLNKIYHSIISVDDLINNFNVDDEGLALFLDYLNNIYAGSPYSYSSELSRKSAGMFRDIVVDNIFRPEKDKWMIYGGLTHIDGGTKDTYYGKGYYTTDIGSSDMDADTKITGAYMLGEYGVSDTLTSGVVIGGNKLKSDLSNGSKVDGSAMYLGAYAKKYIGNLKVTAGAGFQYGDYDTDRLAVNKVASDLAESVMKYSDNYNDITYDIYLNGRYSHNIGNNLFLEPYATLSYTYVDQDGANEGSKVLAIETDSKSFDYTVGKVGVDLKKVIPHEKGKSTLSAGVSYTKILDGADEEHITGRFKGGSDFDILVAHKNEHSIGLNAKYALELENGIIFDVKGTYSVERDSHNGSGKNRTKGEWIVGAGLGYKF